MATVGCQTMAILKAWRASFGADIARESRRASFGAVRSVDRNLRRALLSDDFASTARVWPASHPTSSAGSSPKARESGSRWPGVCPSFWRADPAARGKHLDARSASENSRIAEQPVLSVADPT